ncbi:MAG: DEAD/DEAH box helicase, partial [Syntrophales bacterium]|nr:DEAD/DEAH box helicase [Syntrophales bacterium]
MSTYNKQQNPFCGTVICDSLTSMTKDYRRRPPRRGRRRPPKTAIPPFTHPDAEPVLKRVFAQIGRPQPTPFQPDPFQVQAVAAIREGDCIVTAPTGAGKTWIAEEAIRAVFEAGGRCWYASPLKALSNAKWVEFSQRFDASAVGILTGDTKENADAPIVVGTTEILRNQLYDAMYRGEDLPCDLVVLDEAHFMGDRERGVVWEEIMIYLPRRINLLLLSATIGNAEEIAAWLSTIREKPCAVIREEKRPVPLYPLFLHPSGRLMPCLEKGELYSKVKAFAAERHVWRPDRLPRCGDILAVLRKYRLLPAIFFLKSRSECDGALKMCPLDREEYDDEAFAYTLEDLLDRFPYLPQPRQLPYVVRGRVAAHHGGQLPAWK